VLEKEALQFLAFEREPPRKYARCESWKGENSRGEEIEVGRIRQAAALRPLTEKIERSASNQQGDREMDQHHVLGVLCQDGVVDIEGIQAHRLLI